MRIKLILLLLLFCCFACRPGHEKRAVANKQLLGRWSISEVIQFQHNDDSISTKCYRCPEIFFAGDETGFIKSMDKQLLPFSWKLDSTSLIIKHTGSTRDSNTFLNNGTYQLLKNAANLTKQIVLTDTVKDIKYILKR